MIATTVALAFGAGIGLAADYQDANHNVCEGTFTFPPCTSWGTHVTGESNVALGDAMMPALTSGSNNVALDFGALASNTSGNGNIAIGSQTLTSNTTGTANIATGSGALNANKTGFSNIATGSTALQSNTAGVHNVASGFAALNENTLGNNNVASGDEAMRSNTIGSLNVALGSFAGRNLTTGSFNLDISNEGFAGESGTTRIGTEGTQTRAFMAGVFPTTLLVGCTVQVTPEGQLGCNPLAGAEGKEGKEGKTGATGATGPAGPEGKEGKTGATGASGPAGPEGKEGKTGATGATGPAGPEGKEGKTGATGPEGKENKAGAIATFASFVKVSSGNCLDYTEMGQVGWGTCPGKTTGYSTSQLLAGPTPASGATVTNLYADTSATLTGTDTVLVAVIDNTTGATLLSCTVNSTTTNHCSNTSGSGSGAAGDNIEVKLTATGSSGNSQPWRVRFRY
jgi:hypothetical protein